MSIPDEAAKLLASSIETPARLGVLLHLRSLGGKSSSAVAVGAACSLAPASAERHLALLCGRGFLKVSLATDLLYAYQPVTPELDALVSIMADNRDDCMALLNSDPIRAFANAFLFRRPSKKRKPDPDA